MPSSSVVAFLLLVALVLAPLALAGHEGGTIPAAFAELHGALGGGGRAGAAVVWTGDVAYVIGGLTDVGTPNPDVAVYDPSLGETTTLATFLLGGEGESLPARHAWSGVWDDVNERVVLFGGASVTCPDGCFDVTHDDVLALYPDGSWETLVPEGQGAFGAWRGVAKLDREVHLFGGCDVGRFSCTDAILRFDLDTDELVDTGYTLRAPGGGMLALAHADGIYLFGGETVVNEASAKSADVELYLRDEGLGAEPVAALARAVTLSTGFFVDDTAFVLGGYVDAIESEGNADVDAVQRWTTGTDQAFELEIGLPDDLAAAGAFFADPYAYVVGGERTSLRDGATTLDEVLWALPAPVALDATAKGIEVRIETLGAIDDAWPQGYTVEANGIPIPVLDARPLSVELDDVDGILLLLPSALGSEDALVVRYEPDPDWPTADALGTLLRAFELELSSGTLATPDALPATRYAPAAAWHDGRLHVLGGIDADCSWNVGYCEGESGILALDLASGASETIGLATLGEVSAVVPTPDGILLVGASADPSTIFRYDPASASVEPFASFPFFPESDARWSLDGPAAAYDGEQYLYVFGGVVPCGDCWPEPSSTIWRVDTQSPEPVVEPLDVALPIAMRDAAAAWLDGRAYLLGGKIPTTYESGEEYLDTVLAFDPEAETAELVASLPAPRADATALALDDSILLFGGFAEAPLQEEFFLFAEPSYADVLRFWPDAEEPLLALPAGLASDRRDHALVWTGETALLVGGGTMVDGEWVDLPEVEAYAPDLEAPFIDIELSEWDVLVDDVKWWTSAPTLDVGATDDGLVSLTVLVDGEPFEIPGELGEGVHEVEVVAKDDSGNVATETLDVHVDLTAPTVAFDGDTLVEVASATVTLTFNEPMDTGSVADALLADEGWSTAWDEEGTVLALTHEALPVGAHTLALGTGATDAHGIPLAQSASHTVTRVPVETEEPDRDDPRPRRSREPQTFLIVEEPTPEPTVDATEGTTANGTEAATPPVEPPASEPVAPLDDAPALEQTSTSGDEGADDGAAQPGAPTPAVATPVPGDEPPAARIVIVQPDGVGVSVDAGARGIVTVRLDGVSDVSSVSIVIIDEEGEETVLSEGQLVTTWDTSESANGYYTIEARRRAPQPAEGTFTLQAEGDVTLAGARVLVRNEPTTLFIAGAAAGAVLLAAAAHAGLSAVAGASGSSASSAAGGFDPLGFAQEVAIDAGQDKLRDKTKEKAALDRKRRIRSVIAAGVSLTVLAGLWALAEAQAWTLREWLLALPIVGAAAALVTAMKFAAEGTLAFATHARPRVRLWVAGTISLVVSSVVLRNPFGYPGYVDETDESEARTTWRMQGLRGLATIAGATAFVLPFLAVAAILPWSFVDVGLLIAVTNAATTAMPFGPLPGRDVWRWNKLAAIGVAAGAFALYVAYAAALLPLWAFAVLGLGGAAADAATRAHMRRTLGPPKPRAKSVPIARQVPVRTPEDEATATVPRHEQERRS